MAGNVWEWCLNLYDQLSDTSLSSSVARVLRGGSWDNSPDRARAAVRYHYNPGYRYDYLGFRVLCSSPIE
jgi:formylglycine-generating enzyme required for sulfatase activity